jgi:hypothetical protein
VQPDLVVKLEHCEQGDCREWLLGKFQIQHFFHFHVQSVLHSYEELVQKYYFTFVTHCVVNVGSCVRSKHELYAIDEFLLAESL